MFALSLHSKGSYDTIVQLPEGAGLQTGDILKHQETILLCLGEKLEFPDLKRSVVPFQQTIDHHLPSFFSNQTMELIHRMVHEYFTTYSKITALFLDIESEKLILYSPKKIKKSSTPELFFDTSKNIFSLGTKEIVGQQLIVFPDLRTLYALTPKNILEPKDSVVLHSHMTTKQHREAFRGIKTGAIKKIFSTYSQIFFDYLKLENITIVHPHKRYYKSQQDPRYHTYEVIKKISEIQKCEVVKVGEDYPRVG